MKIELFYFEGCPSYEELRPRLQKLAREAGVEDVRLRSVESDEAAQAERFLGSPSVRVNDRDVDPTAATRSDFGMKCRIYLTTAGPAHTPPDEWILRAIEEAQHG